MIPLDPVVEIAALSDPDRLQPAPRSILEPVCRVARYDRLAVGPAAVDHDPLGVAMPVERFAQEPFGGGQITPERRHRCARRVLYDSSRLSEAVTSQQTAAGG